MSSRNLSVAASMVAAVVVAVSFAQIVRSLAHLGVAWWLSLSGSVAVLAVIVGLVWWLQYRAGRQDPAFAGLTTGQRRQVHRATMRGPIPDDSATRGVAITIVRRSVDQDRRSRRLEWVAAAGITLAVIGGVIVFTVNHTVPEPMFYALPLLPLLWLLARQRSRLRLTELNAGPTDTAAEG